MARIRTIKPEFPQSESIGRISRDARLLFIQLWTLSDDEGRLRGNSRMLASLLYPYDDDARDLLPGWLSELISAECVFRYEVDGETYIQICKWLNHQKIDKPSKSKIPPIPQPFAKPREDSKKNAADQGRDQGRDQGVEGKRKNSPPTGGHTFSKWIESLNGKQAIPADHHVFAYAGQVGIPDEFLALSWAWFEKTYGQGGIREKKRYVDWPGVFRNAVEGNWAKAWFCEGDSYKLTTVGFQLQRELKVAA